MINLFSENMCGSSHNGKSFQRVLENKIDVTNELKKLFLNRKLKNHKIGIFLIVNDKENDILVNCINYLYDRVSCLENIKI